MNLVDYNCYPSDSNQRKPKNKLLFCTLPIGLLVTWLPSGGEQSKHGNTADSKKQSETQLNWRQPCRQQCEGRRTGGTKANDAAGNAKAEAEASNGDL